MLAERITNIAPDMPPDIRRWFLERDYAKPSVQHQDWDLNLAEWDFLPLLVEYVEDPANLLDKRFEAFSALMVLQSLDAGGPEDERRKKLHQEIQRIVLANQDFARKVCDEWLGLVEALTIKRMLGENIPDDVPQWVHDAVTHRLVATWPQSLDE